jgi:hypothetical protein
VLAILKRRIAETKLGRRLMVHARVARVLRANSRLREGLAESKWAVRIAAPTGPDGDRYGDVPFASDLARALRPHVGSVQVLRRDEVVRDADVVLTLRGLTAMPRIAEAVNILWVISHPDLVSIDELRDHDLVYSAGSSWARAQTAESGVQVVPLLQATDPSRFHPQPGIARSGVVFVGTTRGVMRPAVLWAIGAGIPVEVHGHGWDEFISKAHIASDHLKNADLPSAYARAEVVLNDHWPDMARNGFISNRVFDAAASGAVVVTDRVDGIQTVSPVLVRVFDSQESLTHLVHEVTFPDASARSAEAVRVGLEHSFAARAERIAGDVAALLHQAHRIPPLRVQGRSTGG